MAALTAAAMLTGAAGTTFYAEEIGAVRDAQTASDADRLDNVCEAVMDFIIENDIAAIPCADMKLNAVTVSYSNYEDMARTADALKEYIKEKGMGDVDITIQGPTDPALEDAMRLINEYIDRSDLHASAHIDTDNSNAVTVDIYNWWEADDIQASVKAFMKENGIDGDKVIFLVFEDGFSHIFGDANGDFVMNVRDCSYIAKKLAEGRGESLPVTADYNRDGKKNVRDAADISRALAGRKSQ